METELHYGNTPQEIFNRVWNVFITNNTGRAHDGQYCQYYLENHPGCAVGCLIKSATIRKNVKNCGISEMDEDELLKFGEVYHDLIQPNFELLNALQCWHDDNQDLLTNDSIIELKNISKEFNLTIPEIV